MSADEFERGWRDAPMRCVADDVVLGSSVYLAPFVNLFGCTIGEHTRIGAFAEIGRGVVIGRRCKISSHTYICNGVRIGDGVFVGHGVLFTNDKYPAALNGQGELAGPEDWTLLPTAVGNGAAIGTGAVIVAGVTIGEGALVGAGAVVTRDVMPHTVVAGVPARILSTGRSPRSGTNAFGEERRHP